MVIKKWTLVRLDGKQANRQPVGKGRIRAGIKEFPMTAILICESTPEQEPLTSWSLGLCVCGLLASCPWRCRPLSSDAEQKLVPQTQISDPYGFPSHSTKRHTWISSQQTQTLSVAKKYVTNGIDFLEENDCRGRRHPCYCHHRPAMAKGSCLTRSGGTFLHPHSLVALMSNLIGVTHSGRLRQPAQNTLEIFKLNKHYSPN